jgi:hypothetical protein
VFQYLAYAFQCAVQSERSSGCEVVICFVVVWKRLEEQLVCSAEAIKISARTITIVVRFLP